MRAYILTHDEVSAATLVHHVPRLGLWLIVFDFAAFQDDPEAAAMYEKALKQMKAQVSQLYSAKSTTRTSSPGAEHEGIFRFRL